MTKTLTEQWRDGTLPQGYYYIVANTEQKHKVVFYLPERKMEDDVRLDLKDQFVLEVLATVPTYAEFKDLMSNLEYVDKYRELVSKTDELVQKMHILEKRLEIATKALEQYSLSDNWFMEDSEGKCWSFNKQYPWRIGFKALKEIKEEK